MDTDFIPPQDSGLPGTMVTTPLKSPPPQDYAKKLVSRRHFLFSAHLTFFALPPHLPFSPLFSSLFLPSLPFSFLYFSLILLSSYTTLLFLPPFSFFIPLISFSPLSLPFLSPSPLPQAEDQAKRFEFLLHQTEIFSHFMNTPSNKKTPSSPLKVTPPNFPQRRERKRHPSAST